MLLLATSLKNLQMSCKGCPVYFRLTLIALLLPMILLASCAPIQQKLVGDPVNQDFADGLLQEWSNRSTRVNSMQGLAKVKVHTPEDSMAGSQVILAEKPNRLRAETLSPFGSPILLLTVDGEDLGVSLPSRKLFYRGAATPENISRFVRIPLSLPALVTVLLYQPPMMDALREEAFELGEKGWLLVRYGTPVRQEIIFNIDRQLVEVSYFDQDKLLLKIDYGQFAEEGDRFPHYFGIELPRQKTTASLEFSDLETNVELRPGIFQLTPPPGSKVVSFDER